ncbi:MAG TPA: DNA-3-methyladenine glycosylase I [Nitriliruptorales bacterium]
MNLDVAPGADGRPRCWWCLGSAEYVAYHDDEWGVPTHDDHRLFEKLCLEGFQAGLSWVTILRKRNAFREAFLGFDPAQVARFDEGDVERLLGDARIVRHRGKIQATVNNARRCLELIDEVGSLDAYVWAFAPDGADTRVPRSRDHLPATSPGSIALSRDLKRRGWRFVGPTTAYAFMQSMGLVNDHLDGCAWR